MLMWKQHQSLLLGGESNKATAVFPVFSKLYEHTYAIKCPSCPPLGGIYSNIIVLVTEMVLHKNNFWNADVGNSVNVCVIGRRKQ